MLPNSVGTQVFGTAKNGDAMIRERFSVFSGIGPKHEHAIWEAGIRDWQQFLEKREIPEIPVSVCASVISQIKDWNEALHGNDAKFFAERLAPADHWQLYKIFGDYVRYLDIETTGLFPGCDEVTMVGIFDGKNYEALVAGKNLILTSLKKAMEGCKLLITYYGRIFDVPFLQEAYPTLDLRIPHFDLCFTGRRLGLKGGLKAVEVSLGIARPEGIKHIDGFGAVQLWYEYVDGNKESLNRLIEYNKADTINLARIASIVYDGLYMRWKSQMRLPC
jgi:uncharacterized protein YprB with RNaseH-like and TPR domain